MKKVMFVLVCLLIASACFALESGPSNKVGYVKIYCAASQDPGNPQAFTPFGLPFVFWDVPTGNVPTYGVESRNPQDIVGTQLTCGDDITGDQIWRQDNGDYCWRTCPGPWDGGLYLNDGMEPARAYYYVNQSITQDVELVLAGEADITAVGIPAADVFDPFAAGEQNFNPYSWRDPREVDRSNLNLLQQGFLGGAELELSDQVWSQNTGQYFWYDTDDNTWQDTPSPFTDPLLKVVPGDAYYIVNAHPGNYYMYSYTASGLPISLPHDGSSMLVKDAKVHTPKAPKMMKATGAVTK